MVSFCEGRWVVSVLLDCEVSVMLKWFVLFLNTDLGSVGSGIPLHWDGGTACPCWFPPAGRGGGRGSAHC